MTLVILAAGMGSRYGGLKQIDPIGPGGEFIIDYSIYDAIRAGFDRVVFIIKEENRDLFEETVGKRVRSFVNVEYAFQNIADVPAGFTVPEGRVKPWGTAHALLSAKKAVGDDSFAVINSDDFYGRESYEKIASFLKNVKQDGKLHCCMCGFILKNTLSENGHVARGICSVDENGMLTSITERTKIQRNNGRSQFFEEATGWTDVSEDSVVSMNMWGFTKEFFSVVEEREGAFFAGLKNPLKDEFYLPMTVGAAMDDGELDVTVLQTGAKWYGVTYREDKALIQGFLGRCIDEGEYPVGLWSLIRYPEIVDDASHFCLCGRIIDVDKIENGHINKTFVITCENAAHRQQRYILQTINTSIFTKPVELMENIQNVTAYLKERIRADGGDEDRETLTLVANRDGGFFYVDDENRYWRVYDYIEGATSYQSVERPILFENAAKAFGHFQRQLADYPADTLHETIEKFHDTIKRYHDFEEAVAKDAVGRAASVQKEIAFYLAHKDICGAITEKIASGEVPLRVTHNDTKLNNIMMDNKTDEGLCVIDLDTVMPGSALYDFGDAIRFGASSAAEDEKDLSKVYFCSDLYESFTRGFLSEAKDALNDAEKDLLPMSCVLMTLECGMRFLGDYLNGDVYFGIHYPEQNLDRARTQMKLVADMEGQLDAMSAIVAKYR